MVDSIMKVLTFFVIVILVLLLINLVGEYIAGLLPEAGQTISNILHSLWAGFQKIIHPGGYGH